MEICNLGLPSMRCLECNICFLISEKHLQRPWDGLKSWALTFPTTHRTPATSLVVKAMFAACLDRAFGSKSYRGWW
eukprot:5170058-Karenia_brevis.AAC.1